MKKFLLSLAAVALCASVSMAEETAAYTCQFGPSYNEKSIQNYTSTWHVYSDMNDKSKPSWTLINFNNNQNGWAYVKCGRNGNASTGSIITDYAAPEKITKIECTIDAITTTNVSNITLFSSTDNNTWEEVQKLAASDVKNNLLTFSVTSPEINQYYKIDFVCTSASSNGVVQLSKVVYYADSSEYPSEPVDPTMSFEPNEIIVNLGSEFKAPELTCNSDGVVTYSSSDEAVATVNSETGVVTLIAKGTTTITATAAATDKFNQGSASYVLNVNLPLPGISFGEQEEYTVMYGNSFTAPVLENPNGVEVSYDSTDTNVATVDAEGNVSIIGIGTTTIIASSEASDKYDYGHASYNLIVKDPNNVTFDFKNNTYGDKRVENGNDTYYMTLPKTFTEGNVSITISCDETNAARFWTDGLRLFKNKNIVMTIVASDEYILKKVEFLGKAASYITINDTKSATWEGSSRSIECSYNNTSSNVSIESINVVIEKDTQSDVESVEFDNNAPKEYYNLQGVRVENPGKGLYIVRQGSKASKVIL